MNKILIYSIVFTKVNDEDIKKEKFNIIICSNFNLNQIFFILNEKW